MTKEKTYYVSLDEKKVIDQPIQGRATLEIIGKPEDIEQIKEYMHKNEDGAVGERYEEDLKALFQLIYDLGTKETRHSLGSMLI